MLEDKDFTLVNVHIPYGGEILRTDLFILYDEISYQRGEPPGKETPIVLRCVTGPRSTTAAEAMLLSLGCTSGNRSTAAREPERVPGSSSSSTRTRFTES